MQRPQRAPWWVFVIAASFLSFYALLLYCDLRRSEDDGFDLRPTPIGLAVDAVHSGSPADSAGVRAGDLILAADGRPLSSRLDWLTVSPNVEFGRPTRLRIARGEEHLVVALERRPASWRRWMTHEGFGLLVAYAVQGVSLVLGIVILVRRQDWVARLGAWVLGSFGVYFLALPSRFFTVWRSLPDLVSGAFWLPFLSTPLVPAVLLAFFLSFPVRRVRSAWHWALLWLPAVAAAIPYLRYQATALYVPDAPLPDSHFGLLLSVNAGYVLVTGVVAVLGYRALRTGGERRRVRVLAVGAVTACAFGLPALVLYWMTPGSLLVFESPTVGLAALLTLLVPLSFAYAILEHRLFDVSFIVRQGVRYAVARRILLSLVPALIALMALDLYSRRHEAVAKLFATRGTVYILLAGAVLIAHRERHRWLDALDRRFFRERYDAQRLLRKVAEEVRSSEGFEQASAHVAARVHLALHPAFAVVLVRDRPTAGYRRIAGVPEGEGPPDLPADGKMVGLALVLGRPIEVRASEAGWLDGEVGPAEAAVLTAARIELLVPIPSAAETGAWSALLALGPRRSDEPYAAEDLDLLQAAAHSLGSLSGRIPGSAAAQRRFSECPRCGLCFDEDRTSCGEDAQPLVVSALPRLLLGRYRINRRLGRGGMGVVYAAADQALARDVAVKVLRDELAADARAAERFEREARLVASFSHPNVVTVHDFGAAAGRGFLVMELLAGASLREILERERRLEPRRVLDVLGPVCAAVDAAHRRRFVHRDLKPENIFLARSDGIETPKVLDFGISKVGRGAAASIPGAETAAGVLLGTPEYMAPEQLRGEDVQPEWDIWALAMVAHEMLTGHRPIPAGFGAEPGGPFLQDEGFSDPSRSFFLGALSIDPANRPPSANAFYDGLRGALLGGP